MKKNWSEITILILVALLAVTVVLFAVCLAMQLSSRKNALTGTEEQSTTRSFSPEFKEKMREHINEQIFQKISQDDIAHPEILDQKIKEAHDTFLVEYLGISNETLEAFDPNSNDLDFYRACKEIFNAVTTANAAIDTPTPVAPLAIAADTGEPISSEPGRPWAGPTD